MKIAILISTLLLAGAAQAGICLSQDRTLAATFADGQITVTRLNGASIVKSVKLLWSFDFEDIRVANGVITLKAHLDDGGRTAIRSDATDRSLKSIRLAYKTGHLEIYATDCR